MAKSWMVPGVAVRDPETGVRWRLYDDGDWTPSDGVLGPWQTVAKSHARAIDAGPDLTDLATAAVYAAVRGWILYPSDTSRGWCCQHRTPWGPRVAWGRDVPDAVRLAKQDPYSEAVQAAAKENR